MKVKLLLLGALTLVGLAPTRTASAADKIVWQPSLAVATSVAKASHKLIMADFYTDWCGWCKKLDADTYSDAKVIKLSDQVVPVKINAEKEGIAAAKKYAVNGYPTILFLSADGDVEGRIGGYLPATDFADQMRFFAKSYADFPALQDRIKQNPNDLDAACELARIYASRGDETNANMYIAMAEKQDPDNSKDFLTKAYNAMGDYYQGLQKFDKAIPFFHKAGKTGKLPSDVAYGYMSSAACYLQMETPSPAKATADLQKIIDLPGASAADKDQAREMLKQIAAQTKQQ